jgi:hypothetical protein
MVTQLVLRLGRILPEEPESLNNEILCPVGRADLEENPVLYGPFSGLQRKGNWQCFRRLKSCSSYIPASRSPVGV